MSDSAPPHVVINNKEEEDDDDDMADLFSFATGPEEGDGAPVLENSGSEQAHPRERTGSDDSLLNMLASETPVFTTTPTPATTTDKESQEILDWLNDDDKKKSNEKDTDISEETTPPEDTTTTTTTQQQQPAAEPEPTVVALPPVFETFHQALHSNQSTNVQIRDLYAKECSSQQILLSSMDRQQVYCRIILNKVSVQEATESSLAQSFDEWKPSAQQDSTSSWLDEQAIVWSERVASLTGRSAQECSADLTKLLQYYFANKSSSGPKEDDNNVYEETHPEMDLLLPAVAATILATGLPVSAASVVLGQFIPTYMPLIAMESQERWEAALSLHTDFYRLACYHLPFLVYHLDQYLPGWHWPRIPVQQSEDKSSATVLSRNLQKRGQLPPSWLLAHFCGECFDSNKCNLPSGILELWDRTLLLQASDMPFFLALVMLQDAADDLLLLTDSALVEKLQDVLQVKENINVQDWWSKAQFLQSRTPDSVIRHLQQSEDNAVQEALQRRQERAEEALQARLQAQAEAHRLEQEKKAEEARDRLTRARLVAFYRKHAPEKETNIDILMEKYKGRYEELDAKVKKKYGEGFNPAVAKPSVAPKQPNKGIVPKGPSRLLVTMNQGLGRGRKDQAENTDESDVKEIKTDQVSVMVSPEDVLPVICWSKEAAAVRGAARRHNRHSHRTPLKFYLVDSRSEEAAQEQGRFPTAVSLGPEAMLDPERIRQNENMFESLRGAVHIVVMGEGFSALPKLYTQKLSPNLDELAQEDDSRTNICALFFVKKGFPFVSVLEGGFAAAHSWLVREGPKHHLSASSVLVDYDPEASLFGQMETYHNASGKEKAQRTMQKMLENSLVSMTRSAQRLERLASDMEQADGNQGLARINIFRRGKSLDDKPDGGKTGKPGEKVGEENRPAFKNPIAMLRRQYSDEKDEPSKPPVRVSKEQPDTKINSDENNEKPSEREISTASTTQEPGRPDPNAMNNSLKGIATALNNNSKSEKSEKNDHKEQVDAKPMSNPFKGFGAALNNTMKVANTNNAGTTDVQGGGKPTSAGGVPNVLKRNPFARFGGGNKQQQPQAAHVEKKQPSATATAARGFAGLNQFRKSTMARMRQNNNDDALQQEEEEEAIAFGAADGTTLDLSLQQQEQESPSANVKQI